MTAFALINEDVFDRSGDGDSDVKDSDDASGEEVGASGEDVGDGSHGDDIEDRECLYSMIDRVVLEMCTLLGMSPPPPLLLNPLCCFVCALGSSVMRRQKYSLVVVAVVMVFLLQERRMAVIPMKRFWCRRD